MMEGTTSACAENTLFLRCANVRVRNYLRVRGEYWSERDRKDTIMELPPRARRILSGFFVALVDIGTTSACAENTFPFSPGGGVGWNYLRVRGEYSDGMTFLLKFLELPPRARRIHTMHP